MSPPEPEAGPGAVHVPVLLHEVLELLDLRPGQTVVDGTVGAGGHACEIHQRIQPGGRLIGLDRDPMMLAHARSVLPADGVELVQSSYAELMTVLTERGIPAIDRLLVDLGLSSDQLDDAARGFRFDSEAGLDMRFDASRGRPATELVNTLPEDALADILYQYGEERLSRRIARRIVERRPLRTAAQLSDAVCSAMPKAAQTVSSSRSASGPKAFSRSKLSTPTTAITRPAATTGARMSDFGRSVPGTAVLP